MGVWEDLKRGWSSGGKIEPAPTSAAAERQTPIFVAMEVSEALDAATMHMLSRGYSVGQRTDRSVSFIGHEGPNMAIGCLLLLLFALPGIIYLIVAGRDTHVSLLATAQVGGCALLIGGDGSEGVHELRRWAASLGF